MTLMRNLQPDRRDKCKLIKCIYKVTLETDQRDTNYKPEFSEKCPDLLRKVVKGPLWPYLAPQLQWPKNIQELVFP